MTRFKLVPYTVRVRKKRSRDRPYLLLGDLDGAGLSLFEVAETILGSLGTAIVYEESQKTISVENLESNGALLQGIVRSGEYGVAADFYDTEEMEYADYKRKTKDSEVFPFYFLLYLPPNRDMGFAIFQSFSAFGIKSLMNKVLHDEERLKYFKLEMNRVISEDVMRLVTENRLVELKLLRHDVPRDIADRVHRGDSKEIYETLSFKIRGKKSLDIPQRVRDMLSNRETRFYEILGTEYDEVKAVVKVGKSTVTITFGEFDKFHEFMALDDDITLEEGFPTYAYLKGKALEYLERLREM